MLNKSYDDKYGLTDPLLGDPVTVNGVSLYDYNADLINYEPVVATITNDLYRKVGKHSYIINRQTFGNNGIKLRFYIGGTNSQQAQINCNKVLRELSKDIVVINIGDTEFEYVGVLNSYTTKYTEVSHYYLLEATMIAVKRLPYVVEEFTESQAINGVVINNEGVINCGVLIAIDGLLTDDSIKIVVNNVECDINNFSSYKYHIIDGLDGKILCDSTEEGIFVDSDSNEFEHATNNFINTTLVEFPYLVPGDNTINVTCDDGSISRVIVKHYPLFVI